MSDVLELLPIPQASTGLCQLCCCDAALPTGVFCRGCEDELADIALMIGVDDSLSVDEEQP